LEDSGATNKLQIYFSTGKQQGRKEIAIEGLGAEGVLMFWFFNFTIKISCRMRK